MDGDRQDRVVNEGEEGNESVPHHASNTPGEKQNLIGYAIVVLRYSYILTIASAVPPGKFLQNVRRFVHMKDLEPLAASVGFIPPRLDVQPLQISCGTGRTKPMAYIRMTARVVPE